VSTTPCSHERGTSVREYLRARKLVEETIHGNKGASELDVAVAVLKTLLDAGWAPLVEDSNG